VYYALAGFPRREKNETGGNQVPPKICFSKHQQHEPESAHLPRAGKIYWHIPDYAWRSFITIAVSQVSATTIRLYDNDPEKFLTKLIRALNTIHDQDSLMMLTKTFRKEKKNMSTTFT
jgi:hypothetical protein